MIAFESIGASEGDTFSGFFATDEFALLSGVIDTDHIVDFSFLIGSIELDSKLGVVNFAELVVYASGMDSNPAELLLFKARQRLSSSSSSMCGACSIRVKNVPVVKVHSLYA